MLYARFENEENTFTCRLLCNPDRPVRFEHESSAWVTRVGIDYRFGGGTYGGGSTAADTDPRDTERKRVWGPGIAPGPFAFPLAGLLVQ